MSRISLICPHLIGLTTCDACVRCANKHLRVCASTWGLLLFAALMCIFAHCFYFAAQLQEGEEETRGGAPGGGAGGGPKPYGVRTVDTRGLPPDEEEVHLEMQEEDEAPRPFLAPPPPQPQLSQVQRSAGAKVMHVSFFQYHLCTPPLLLKWPCCRVPCLVMRGAVVCWSQEVSQELLVTQPFGHST